MRLVLFQFYTFETALTMLLIFYHIHGFFHVLDHLPYMTRVFHYLFSAIFYTFGVLTLFASINICTGHNISLGKEVARTICGSVLHIFISLATLIHAEKDFHLMYIMSEWNLEVERPVHPFLNYLRAQAFCALICSIVYSLHAIIVIDVILSNEENTTVFDDGEDVDDDDYDDYIPVRLYVLGEIGQTRLERMDWFADYERGAMQPV